MVGSPLNGAGVAAEYGPERRHGRHVVLINIPEAGVGPSISDQSRGHIGAVARRTRAVVTMQNRTDSGDDSRLKVMGSSRVDGRATWALIPDGLACVVTSRGRKERSRYLSRGGRNGVIHGSGAGISISPDA